VYEKAQAGGITPYFFDVVRAEIDRVIADGISADLPYLAVRKKRADYPASLTRLNEAVLMTAAAKRREDEAAAAKKRWEDEAAAAKKRREDEAAEERRIAEEQSKRWVEHGLCRHCGGTMGGLFTRKCKSCGKAN
jgi:hypothetical protein